MNVAGTRHWRNELDCFRRLRKSFRRQVEAGGGGIHYLFQEVRGLPHAWWNCSAVFGLGRRNESMLRRCRSRKASIGSRAAQRPALSPAELKTLGEAVRTAEPKDPMAAAALKLLALTGMRRQEAVKLMWSDYDRAGSCLHLGDTKTGRSTRPLVQRLRHFSTHGPPA
jgi:hypothetical protein